MKLKYFALSMAFMMAIAMTGCSAGREDNSTAPVQPTSSASSDSGAQTSRYPQASSGMDNDAAEGGGAGGTNSPNSDGLPDSSSGISSAVDDIGDAAGDLARGAGNVARDAGSAIGSAANDAGSAMR